MEVGGSRWEGRGPGLPHGGGSSPPPSGTQALKETFTAWETPAQTPRPTQSSICTHKCPLSVCRTPQEAHSLQPQAASCPPSLPSFQQHPSHVVGIQLLSA